MADPKLSQIQIIFLLLIPREVILAEYVHFDSVSLHLTLLANGKVLIWTPALVFISVLMPSNAPVFSSTERED